jgi:hypothetical protein
LRKVAVDQKYVEKVPVLVAVCSNISRSIGLYGSHGKEFNSITDSAFASLLVLLTAINEEIGAFL